MIVGCKRPARRPNLAGDVPRRADRPTAQGCWLLRPGGARQLRVQGRHWRLPLLPPSRKSARCRGQLQVQHPPLPRLSQVGLTLQVRAHMLTGPQAACPCPDGAFAVSANRRGQKKRLRLQRGYPGVGEGPGDHGQRPRAYLRERGRAVRGRHSGILTPADTRRPRQAAPHLVAGAVLVAATRRLHGTE